MEIIQLKDGEPPRRLDIDAVSVEGAKSTLTNGHPWQLIDLGEVHHAATPVRIVGMPAMDTSRALDIPFDAVNAFANSVVANGDGFSVTEPPLVVAEDVAYALMTNAGGDLIDWLVAGAGGHLI